MNLLLFLSALLSALTGVVGGGRVADVPQYEAIAVRAVRVVAVPAHATARPVTVMPGLDDVASLPVIASFAAPAPPAPLYAGRRRE